jgi:diaphanous 1
MPSGSDILIVPTILPTGSLHFAEVPNTGRAQDVVDVLLAAEGLKEEVLGDLEDCGWSLQRLRAERSGRPWEEEELLALGDG